MKYDLSPWNGAFPVIGNRYYTEYIETDDQIEYVMYLPYCQFVHSRSYTNETNVITYLVKDKKTGNLSKPRYFTDAIDHDGYQTTDGIPITTLYAYDAWVNLILSWTSPTDGQMIPVVNDEGELVIRRTIIFNQNSDVDPFGFGKFNKFHYDEIYGATKREACACCEGSRAPDPLSSTIFSTDTSYKIKIEDDLDLQFDATGDFTINWNPYDSNEYMFDKYGVGRTCNPVRTTISMKKGILYVATNPWIFASNEFWNSNAIGISVMKGPKNVLDAFKNTVERHKSCEFIPVGHITRLLYPTFVTEDTLWSVSNLSRQQVINRYTGAKDHSDNKLLQKVWELQTILSEFLSNLMPKDKEECVSTAWMHIDTPLSSDHNCMCVICHLDLSDSECVNDTEQWVKMNSCRHTYHLDCISTYLKNHTTCPTCRAEIYMSGDKYDTLITMDSLKQLLKDAVAKIKTHSAFVELISICKTMDYTDYEKFNVPGSRYVSDQAMRFYELTKNHRGSEHYAFMYKNRIWTIVNNMLVIYKSDSQEKLRQIAWTDRVLIELEPYKDMGLNDYADNCVLYDIDLHDYYEDAVDLRVTKEAK